MPTLYRAAFGSAAAFSAVSCVWVSSSGVETWPCELQEVGDARPVLGSFGSAAAFLAVSRAWLSPFGYRYMPRPPWD
jgi:hypothetical protein